MEVKLSKKFTKQLEKAPLVIRKAFEQRMRLFLLDRSNPLLNLHKLGGRFNGCFSINITGDWRSVYEKLEDGEVLLFTDIGTHSQLYK